MDRRPWLILSRAEAIALENAVLQLLAREQDHAAVPAALGRALRVIEKQLRYIEGSADGGEPSILEALLREEGKWDA